MSIVDICLVDVWIR